MSNIKRFRTRKRSVILLLIDAVIILCANVLCALLIWFGIPVPWTMVLENWVLVTCFLLIFMFILNTNSYIWRYASPKELCSLVNTYILAGLSVLIIRLLSGFGARVSLIFFSTALASLASVYIRTVYRSMFSAKVPTNNQSEGARPLAIIGAGSVGVALMQEIARNKENPFTVWGFFDDDASKIGMSINGVAVRGCINDIPEIIKQSPVHDIVLAIPSLDLDRRREIIDMCGSLQCKFKILPDRILTMEDDENRLSKAIREVKIEDLLGRSSISFTAGELAGFLRGKTVLVTGGGGSIGSELCRQITTAGAKKLVILEVNENSSYMLQNEIKHQLSSEIEVVVEIGSMTDKGRVNQVFDRHRPQVVFHAAAHKHVPLMEHSPTEAVRNNIFGTCNVVCAASANHAEKFVLISTDKAVNPTSIMGATKRYCEDMIRAWSATKENTTTFVSVRFGNVLGSDGSVIPIFQNQIAHGGPVTVTDFRMTRYFMTIPEAVGLVLKSGAMAQASETYILDMGEPVKILSLAENLIRLSGLEPYKDIQIVETGLRGGEKLYEELLVKDGAHEATKESKILIETNRTEVDWDTIAAQQERLKQAIRGCDDDKVMALMKEFVNGYKDAEDANSSVPAAESGREPKSEPPVTLRKLAVDGGMVAFSAIVPK